MIGTGGTRFEEAAAEVMRWGMLRGAGLRVEATTEVADVGSEVIVGLGPVRAPCRVVYVVDEPDRRGFAYGTLPGHAETGEELFAVRYDPATEAVYAEVTCVLPARDVVEPAGGPVTSLAQRVISRRYLRRGVGQRTAAPRSWAPREPFAATTPGPAGPPRRAPTAAMIQCGLPGWSCCSAP